MPAVSDQVIVQWTIKGSLQGSQPPSKILKNLFKLEGTSSLPQRSSPFLQQVSTYLLPKWLLVWLGKMHGHLIMVLGLIHKDKP